MEIFHECKIGSLWFFYQLLGNFRSAITVALVNVPLSISLAIAGGASPSSGIVSAFWAGLMSSLFGGSEFNIVGPTGALSGTLAAASETYGQGILVWLSIWTGILSLLIWYFRIEDYFMFIPNAVLHGFTAGVAIIICLGQVDSALGLTAKHISSKMINKFMESMFHISELQLHPITPIFFLINFIVLLYLLKKFPKYPWAVLITIIGIGYIYFIISILIVISLIITYL